MCAIIMYVINYCIRRAFIMKLVYEKIEIEIQEIDNEDIITTSTPTPVEHTVNENIYFDFFDLE